MTKTDLFNFLDAPWQEDREIKLIALINEYRDQFRSDPLSGLMSASVKNYLKRLAEENNIFGDQLFSETFLEAYKFLIS